MDQCVRAFMTDHGTVETSISWCQPLYSTTERRNLLVVKPLPEIQVAGSERGHRFPVISALGKVRPGATLPTYVVSHCRDCEFPQGTRLIIRKLIDTRVYSEVTRWNSTELHWSHGTLQLREIAPDSSQRIAFQVQVAIEENWKPNLTRECHLEFHFRDVVFAFGQRPGNGEASSDRPSIRLEVLLTLSGLNYNRHHRVRAIGLSDASTFIEIAMPVPQTVPHGLEDWK